MADITQQLGFEATAAIATLNSLNAAIKGLNRSLRSLKTAAGGANLTGVTANLSSVDAAAKSAATSVNSLGKKVVTSTKSATVATNKLTISWETFGRVIATQILVRGIAALQQSLAEAANRTKDFETASLRASIVSEEGSKGVDSLREAFERLTIATGRSIEEITEAGTEALQKDLGSTKDTMDLLSGAADNLARITGTSLVSAVNSISSVMKAFNLPLSEANNIADTFFVTIDKGDIKLGEVESRLGTVNPLIAALGGNFEDAAGAAAALTLSGLNTQTSMTQLRNVAIKLIKPTEEMEEVFAALGVTSGTQLIPKFGTLENVLKALSREVGKDREKFGDLFNTIRGLLGVLNLTSNEGRILARVMEAMDNKLGQAEEGADDLKRTLSFLNDVSTESLLREIDNLGPALNEIRLGATILATNFVKVMKDMSDSAQAFANVLINDVKAAIDFIDSLSASGIAKAERARIADIQNAAQQSTVALEQAVQQIQEAGRVERSTSGAILPEVEKEFNRISVAAESAAVAQAKITERAKFTRAQLLRNIEAQREFARLSELATGPSLFGDPAVQAQAAEQAEATAQRLAELSGQILNSEKDQLSTLQSKIELEARKVEAAAQEGILSGKALDAARGQIVSLQQQVKGREKLLGLEGEGATQVQIQEALKREAIEKTGIELGERIPEQTNKATDAINAVPNPQVDASSAIAQMRSLEAAALAAARAIAAANSSSGTLNAYHGGKPVFRAHGGRGQDTVPAMLSEGEFVMNSKSSRKFFSQINAMNAGQQPAFRDQGGPVTNIGDINVNVTSNSGSESPDVGREIANSLRRELRRKSSTL